VGHEVVVPDVERGADELEEGIVTRGVSAIRGANGLGPRATDGGLTPATGISVEPIGIPTLPTDDTEPIAVSDDEPNAPTVEGALPVPAQPDEADPDRPPPSNKLEVPPVDVPEFVGLPKVKVPMPADVCAVPSEQAAAPAIAGNVPDIVGLTPSDESSVAPIGSPIGPTGALGPTPSGDVRPSGGPGKMLVPPTCA
jgi:hypothetical protein